VPKAERKIQYGAQLSPLVNELPGFQPEPILLSSSLVIFTSYKEKAIYTVA
jgi:hypothetical protein